MQALKEHQEEEIRDLLMGHRVVNVEVFTEPVLVDGHYTYADGSLTLDSGQVVYIVPNKGGCSCGAGDYDLKSLERVDNVITRVDFQVYEEEPDQWGTTYLIFVLAGHEQINLLTVYGDDGSGYYGTGYELVVAPGPLDVR